MQHFSCSSVLFFRWERWSFPLSFSFSFFLLNKGRGSVDLSQREKLSHLPSLQIENTRTKFMYLSLYQKIGPQPNCMSCSSNKTSDLPSPNVTQKRGSPIIYYSTFQTFHVNFAACLFPSLIACRHVRVGGACNAKLQMTRGPIFVSFNFNLRI